VFTVRFVDLRIQNFRAISDIQLSDLGSVVVVAGPNGCGKSCIFDALRLLKSAHGGYQFNEWLQWFTEFQINPQDPSTLTGLFRDKTRSLSITATMVLSDEEKAHLIDKAESILEPLVWAELTNQPIENFQYSSLLFSGQFPHLVPTVAQLVPQRAADLRQEVQQQRHVLNLVIPPGGSLSLFPSLVARVVFQTYTPESLGILEFHSASRSYTREAVGGVNLDLRAIEGQRRTQSLYNWQGKYANVKSELITTYLHDILAREAGSNPRGAEDLNETLKELFLTFFPDKEYLGVQPTSEGTIQFPVRLKTGETHDLNELSSGEKELLFGYLRLRNATPHHSTILMDEPELHLNPGLLQGFLDFHYRHLALANDNQLWLVTHSDALLRQAVGNPNFDVFHMTHASAVSESEPQILPVKEDELQQAIIDLVGDVAAYRPYAKVLIFEGDGTKQFDVTVVERLFPKLSKRINLVSGESKGRVDGLYSVLARTASQVGLADRFYAIVDRDSDPRSDPPANTHVLKWDVYHIENFLLESHHILVALSRIAPDHRLDTEASILSALRTSAQDVVDDLVVIRLRKEINDRLVGSIKLGASGASTPARDLMPSVAGSFERLETAKADLMDLTKLEGQEVAIRQELENALTDSSWMTDFPGRLILRRFVHNHCNRDVSYDAFVNLVLNSMVEEDFKPESMRLTLAQVVSDP
jgi:predicted ATPase